MNRLEDIDDTCFCGRLIPGFGETCTCPEFWAAFGESLRANQKKRMDYEWGPGGPSRVALTKWYESRNQK